MRSPRLSRALRRLAASLLLAAAGLPCSVADLHAECEVPSEHYGVQGLHDEVTLGPVLFRQPIGENGTANPLNILDCDADGTLELFITVSPEAEAGSPAQPAEMVFRRGACESGSPSLVSYVFTQGGLEATWRAYDASGSLVDTATSSVSGTKQSVVLASPAGIARVVIAGIRLCIERVCWDCGSIPAGDEGCADPAEAFTEPGVMAVAHLGPVVVTEATFPHGAPAPLTAMDCDGGDGLDLFIRWSENPDAPVRFHFPVGCGKGDLYPEVVVIRFQQAFPSVTWNAYDPAGQLVDSETTAGSAVHQTVVLSSAAGVHHVAVLGQSICIDEVCWRCELPSREPRFRRGDSDSSGELTLGDAVRTLNFLFLGTVQLSCMDAADFDDDGIVQLNDAIRTLGFLFLGGPRPSGSEGCAEDATADEIGCESYRTCEL